MKLQTVSQHSIRGIDNNLKMKAAGSSEALVTTY
jgi:hypothetical protein